MNICKKFTFSVSQDVIDKCDNKDIIEQINILNMYIFEDTKINHISRLKKQYELLEFSETKNTHLSSAYILNLISQTNIQIGSLSTALDSSMKAKSKWKSVVKQKHGLSGLVLCYSDIGQIYMKMGLIDESLEYFDKGLSLLDNSDELFVPFFKIHYHLAEVYYDLNFFSKSYEIRF